jgi:nuclear pore complex protein Nup53
MQQKYLTGFQSPISSSSSFNNIHQQQQQQQNQQHSLYQSQNQVNNNNNNASVSGPPISSLYDSLYESKRIEKSFQTPTRNFYQHNASVQFEHTPIINQNNQQHQQQQFNNSGFNQSRIMSPIPHTINDFNDNSYQNSFVHEKKDFWITVFGFPPESTSIVLSHFSTCGTILEKSTDTGNWIHLRYSSRGECDKALLYNGKVIAHNLMIGVIRCKEETITDKENGEYPPANISKIRSLTQAAYKSAKIEREVVQGGEEPKKTSGIVHKTLDLIFGW